MKVLVLAGLIAMAAAPLALAAESTAECELDETRRDEARRAEAGPQTARPTVAQRSESTTRATPQRRRSGKRIPDAELIGPRGAL